MYADIIPLVFTAKNHWNRSSRKLRVTCHRNKTFGTLKLSEKYVPVSEELSNGPLEESAATIASKDSVMLAAAHVINDETPLCWYQLREMREIW